MREDGFDQLLGVALLAQDRRAVLRMFVQRGVDLVVEVVQEGGRARVLVLRVEACIRPDRRLLDGERVPQQRSLFVYCVSVSPRLLAGRPHGAVP
jgi:hypothetical protein